VRALEFWRNSPYEESRKAEDDLRRLPFADTVRTSVSELGRLPKKQRWTLRLRTLKAERCAVNKQRTAPANREPVNAKGEQQTPSFGSAVESV
jgi:hypothetical protein